MVNIVDTCTILNKELSKNETKEDILLGCVSTKLSSLYTKQSEDLDNIIDELSRSISIDDIEYMYKVIKKLTKTLNTNRKQLIRLLEEMNYYGKV